MWYDPFITVDPMWGDLSARQWALLIVVSAFVLLVVDFVRDKRRTERQERYGVGQFVYAPADAYKGGSWPREDASDTDPIGGTTPEAHYNRNIAVPLGHGQEPQAYYQPKNDIYILPIRYYELEMLRYALNTMPPKTMYTGDRDAVIRRMENAEK